MLDKLANIPPNHLATSADDPGQPLGGETHLLSAPLPVGLQRLKRMVHLRTAGGQHRRLPSRRSVGETFLLPPCFELVSSPGEHVDLVAGEPFNVGHPLVDRLPPHPQPLGQLVSENGLVEVPGGELIPKQQPPVNTAPYPVDTFHLVGHYHMSVQLRVVGTGGELGKRRRHKPRSLDRPCLHPKPRFPVVMEDRVTVVVEDWGLRSTPGRRRHRLQIPERGGRGLIERLHHLASGLFVSEGPEQRHRLVRREGHIPRRHPILAESPTELLTGGGMLTVEEPDQCLGTHRAVQPLLGGTGPPPYSGGHPASQVVVLPW